MGKLKQLFLRRRKPDGIISAKPNVPPSYKTYDPVAKDYAGSIESDSTVTADLTRASYNAALNIIPEVRGDSESQGLSKSDQISDLGDNSNPYSSAGKSYGVSRSARLSFLDRSRPPHGGDDTNTKPPGLLASKTGEEMPSAAEVRRCTKLLRRMFELRMQAWAMQGVHFSDDPLRVDKIRQADLILVDIRGIVSEWRKLQTPGQPPTWSEGEMEELAWIEQTLADPNWEFGLRDKGGTESDGDEKTVAA